MSAADAALPCAVGNARSEQAPAARVRPATANPYDGLLWLEHLLRGTPEADLIPLLYERSVNADGFPYPDFLEVVRRACQDAQPDALPALRERLRAALRERADNGGFDPPLAHHVAGAMLGGVPWTALSAAASTLYGSQARLAMVAAQLATTVLPRLSEGSWRAAVSALQLLPLDTLLPSLRGIEQIDAIIRALPHCVADELWHLHESVQEVSDTLSPARPTTLALVSLAAVLWTLYERASPVPAVQGGDARNVLGLAQHARTAAQWHRRLAALFVGEGAAPRASDARRQDIVGYSAIKQQLDEALARGLDDDTVLRTVMDTQQRQLDQRRLLEPEHANERPLQAMRHVIGTWVGSPDAPQGLCTQLSEWLGEHVRFLASAPPQAAATAPPIVPDVDPRVAELLFTVPAPGTASAAAHDARVAPWPLMSVVASAIRRIGNVFAPAERSPPPQNDTMRQLQVLPVGAWEPTADTAADPHPLPAGFFGLHEEAIGTAPVLRSGALTLPAPVGEGTGGDGFAGAAWAAPLRAPSGLVRAHHEAGAREASDRIHAVLAGLQDADAGREQAHYHRQLGMRLSPQFDANERTVGQLLADLWRAQLYHQRGLMFADKHLSREAERLVEDLLLMETMPDEGRAWATSAGVEQYAIAQANEGDDLQVLPGARVVVRGTAGTVSEAAGPLLLVPGQPITECADSAAVQAQLQRWSAHPGATSASDGAAHMPRFTYSLLPPCRLSAQVVDATVAAYVQACHAAQDAGDVCLTPQQGLGDLLALYPPAPVQAKDASPAALDAMRLHEHVLRSDMQQVLASLPAGADNTFEHALRQPLDRGFDARGLSARDWLVAQWTRRMAATHDLRQAQQTLSKEAADLLIRALDDGGRVRAAALPAVGRFAVTLQIGGQAPRQIPGAVVVSASDADASPLQSGQPVLLMLPTEGIIECEPAHLPQILQHLSGHGLKTLFAQMPLDHLQPTDGGDMAVAFGFPARKPGGLAVAVVDELIEGHRQICRYQRDRMQPQPAISETLDVALAGPAPTDRIISQLATLGLLQTPLQRPGLVMEVVRAWPRYLQALQQEVALGGAVPPLEYRTSQQLALHANSVLRDALQQQGIDLDPDDIRVRWTVSTLSPDNGQLPDAEIDAAFIRREGAGLATVSEMDLSLTELSIRNVALFDIDYRAAARVSRSDGTAIPGLDATTVRTLVRRVDVASAYQAHLQEQFDPAHPGGTGRARLQAFRHALPARLRLDLALQRVSGRGAPPRLFAQWLADPDRRVVDHDGRSSPLSVGGLQLRRAASGLGASYGSFADSVALPGEQEVVAGTLALSADRTAEIYVPGLLPDPFLVFTDQRALRTWLADPGVNTLLRGRLRSPVLRGALESGHLSRVEGRVSKDEGDDPVQAHYTRAWKHLQVEADALSTSTGEQRLKDAWTCAMAAFEVAENFLPARLQLLSAMVRAGISAGRVVNNPAMTSAQRTGAWAAALMDIIDVAGHGPPGPARPGRVLHDPRLPHGTRGSLLRAAAGSASFRDTDGGRVRVAPSTADIEHAPVAIVDPILGEPSGGRVVWVPATQRWRIEVGRVLDDTSVTFFSSDLTDAQLERMSTQGTGVYDVDQRQFVRIGGRWYESETRPELDGGRYIKAPDGQIQPQLPLARQAGRWVIVHRPAGGLAAGGRRSAVGPRADLRDDAPGGRWIPDRQLDDLAAVHGAYRGSGLDPALRHDLRVAARQAFLDRVARGEVAIDDATHGRLALLCAFVADAQLSGGHRIDLNVRNRGQDVIRVGRGADAMMAFDVDVDDELPSLAALIEAAGPQNLRPVLGLDAQATPAQLQRALRQRLAATVAAQRDAVGAQWERALRQYEPTPQAVSQLTQQTGMDDLEARVLLQRYPVYGDEMPSRPAVDALQDRADDVRAETRQRDARREVVRGRIVTSEGLQALLPSLAAAFRGHVLRAGATADARPQLHIETPFLQRALTFDVDGVTLDGGDGRSWLTWQDAIHALSGADRRSRLHTAETLRDTVIAELARTPLQHAPSGRSHSPVAGGADACGSGRISKRSPCVVSASKPNKAISAQWDTLRDRATALRSAAKREVSTVIAGSGKLGDLGLAEAREAALKRSNIMTFKVDIRVGGKPIAYEKAYVSHGTLSGVFGFAATEVKALKVVVPATYRGVGPEPRQGLPRDSDYMARDAAFDGVRRDEFPFGRDYVKPTTGQRYDRNGVTLHRFGEDPILGRAAPMSAVAQAESLAQLRRQLIKEGFDPATVNTLKLGDAYYRTRATRCTEVQALQELAQMINAMRNGGLDTTVRGSIIAFSDMPPCDRNCQRLLREAARMLPNVDIKVASGDRTTNGEIPEHTRPPTWFHAA
ncbi:hypothetical protein [Stenotrophomonas sp. CFBP 13718]|uniref:hypothetical protein n=1 Tax=Stenotrophomonas sp. CFBP 13718 TaxID=2775304 RepID=UPI0017834FAF|nr:hypothetical protein [Stenotrophomonas sp. CFBP 13718]MBD8697315.1 hypothetical protein [Stenotrophomonas sp. CFBP 13718]